MTTTTRTSPASSTAISSPSLLTVISTRSLFTTLSFGSALLSAFSATLQGFASIIHRHHVNNPRRTLIAAWDGWWEDIQSTIDFATGKRQPDAPETMGIREENWTILQDPATVARQLKTWSDTQGKTLESYSPQDILIFREAARVLTVACAAAYLSIQHALTKFQSWSTMRLIHSGHAQAMLWISKEASVAILAFRGTELPDIRENWRETIPDWWRNLQFTLVDYPFGPSAPAGQIPQIAQGFEEGWRLMREEVLEVLKEAKLEMGEMGKSLPLYVCGHSQGAALAGCSVLDLVHQDYVTLRGCLTLAPPKFCNNDYVEQVNDSCKDIPIDILGNHDMTGYDPVVSVPPQAVAPDVVGPPGRFWGVREGEPTTGPMSREEHLETIDSNSWMWRLVLSAPLHWPGGRVGYLNALNE